MKGEFYPMKTNICQMSLVSTAKYVFTRAAHKRQIRGLYVLVFNNEFPQSHTTKGAHAHWIHAHKHHNSSSSDFVVSSSLSFAHICLCDMHGLVSELIEKT